MTVEAPAPSPSHGRRLRRAGVAFVAAVGVVATVLSTPAADAAPAAAAAAAPQTVSADGLPTVQINGVAWSQVVVGTTVYVAGSFTSARPAGSPLGSNEIPRSNLLAYDIRTGELIQSFNHVLNGDALTIAATPDGSRVYVGGKFTTVDGVNRYRLAAFDVATGNLVTTFKPTLNASVGALAVTNDTVYFGGPFGNVNGVARTRAAAVNLAGGLLSWAPTIDNYGVNAMIVTPDRTGVVIGGRFSSVNGQPAYGSVAVDAVTGASRQWALNQTIKGSNTAGTLTLTTDGTLIYGGNYTYGGGNFEGTWAADPTTGAIVWANDCLGDTYSLVPVAGVLYSSSHAHNCAAMGAFPEVTPRVAHYALAYDLATNSRYNVRDAYGNDFSAYHTSAMLQWFPTLTGGTYTGTSQAGWSVTGNADYIAFGGEFPTVNGVKQQGLVRFPAHPISPNKLGPSGVGAVSATQPGAGQPVTAVTAPVYDPDDATLTYQLILDGNIASPVASAVLPAAPFWLPANQTPVTLTAPAPAPGTHTYAVRVIDPSGNAVTGPATAPVVDYARGRPATQSSTAFGASASRAVDGNTDGAFWNGSVTHTNGDANSWWQVDLGQNVTLTTAEIYNRTDCCSERLSDYWVFVSSTPFDTTLTPAKQAAVPGVWSSRQTRIASSPSVVAVPATGRYVMIQENTANQNLSLAEVRVNGRTG